MDIRQKILYHQIHPAKLFTDIIAAVVSVVLLWQHNLIAGLVIAFMPPILVSWWLLSKANLEGYKQSTFGRYVKRYMTRTAEGLRLLGAFILLAGAWYHLPWLIAAALLLVLFCWVRGLLFPASNPA